MKFICKFTYEFICHRFSGHGTQKCSPSTAKFCLRNSYKMIQVTKCSPPMTQFCLANPYKRTPEIAKFSPAAARVCLTNPYKMTP